MASLQLFRNFAHTYKPLTFAEFQAELRGPFLLVRVRSEPRKIVNLRDLLAWRDDFIMGRDPSCEVMIPGDTGISRQHCRLLFRNGQWYLQDLNSANGTLLQDRPLSGGTHAISLGHTFFMGTDTQVGLFSSDQVFPLLKSVRSKNTEGSGLNTAQTMRLSATRRLSASTLGQQSFEGVGSLARESDRVRVPAWMQVGPEAAPAPNKAATPEPAPTNFELIENGQSLDLKTFVDQIQGMDEQSFLQRFPGPVMLRLITPKRHNADPYAPPQDGGVSTVLRIGELRFWRLADIDGQVTNIGRREGSDILLAHESVSRRHAVVLESDKGWIIRDLNSANGTFVDGHRIRGEFVLGSKSLVRFGHDLVLQFMLAQEFWSFLQFFRRVPQTA